MGNFQASKLSEQVTVFAEALALAFAKRKILQSDANEFTNGDAAARSLPLRATRLLRRILTAHTNSLKAHCKYFFEAHAQRAFQKNIWFWIFEDLVLGAVV